MLLKKNIYSNLLTWLLCGFAFLLLLKVSLAIIILPIIGATIIICDRKNILPGLLKSPIAIIFIIYYLWHAVGIIWSENTSYAYMDMGIKLSFIAFPLIFSAIVISNSTRRKVLIAFVAGCIFTCLYLLLDSLISYIQSGDVKVFFYIELSRFIHPTYLSMYLNMALLILISLLNTSLKQKEKILILACMLFLIVFIMMLVARMAIITCIATCSLYIMLKARDYKLQKRIFFLLSFYAVCFISFYISNKFLNRLDQVTNAVTQIHENKPETFSEYNSSSSRPELWKESIEVILKHPFIGAGTGDIKDELFQEYESRHFTYALDRKLNPHNQFLHTTVGLGLIGLLILLLCFGSQFYFSFVNNEWLYFSFLAILLMNGLTESNIEVQSGILLFNFFSLFFYSHLKSGKMNQLD